MSAIKILLQYEHSMLPAVKFDQQVVASITQYHLQYSYCSYGGVKSMKLI